MFSGHRFPIALAVLLLSRVAHAGLPADVITVGPEGAAEDCSAATIQEAVAIANADPSRRRIWVRGSFAPNEVINPGSAIVIDTNLDLEITGGFPALSESGRACSAQSPAGRTDYSGDGGAQDPVFRIRGSGTVTLKNLDISRGDADRDEGGGIDYRGSGTLVLMNSVIGLNEARGAGSGGGIAFRSSGGEADLVLIQTQVLQNQAQFGGGVMVAGTGRLTVNGSIINENVARSSGGGVYVQGSGGSVNVYLEQGVSLSGNSAGDDGGGMYLGNAALEWSGADGEMWINTAADMGGGLYLTDRASADIFTRGRLYPPSGQYHAAISANQARHGGGIAAAAFDDGAAMRVRLSSHNGGSAQLIANNQASERGGAFFLKAYHGFGTSQKPILCLRDTAIVNNRAARGAAIYSQRSSYGGNEVAPDVFANIDGFNQADCPDPGPARRCPAGSECSEITGNQSTVGAVVDLEMADSFASFARTKFVGNSGSVLVYSSDTTAYRPNMRLISNLFALNTISESLILAQDSGVWFLNNTVADNTLGRAVVDVRNWPSTHLAVKRNIIIQPNSNAVDTNGRSPPEQGIFRNLTTDDALALIDPSNFNAEPQFTPDYRLRRTSPAVDRTFVGETTRLDIAGYPRPVDLPDVPNDGGSTDLGAYELQIGTSGTLLLRDGFEPLSQ